MTPPIEICYRGESYCTSNEEPTVDINLEINGEIDPNISIHLENEKNDGGSASICTKQGDGSTRTNFIKLESGEVSEPIIYKEKPIIFIGKPSKKFIVRNTLPSHQKLGK